MRSEIGGEDFSGHSLEFQKKKESARGRPSEIEPEILRRNVYELQFALEQNWGDVGWLLSQARTEQDIRAAFQRIVNPRCNLLEPFIRDHTQCSDSNLRTIRGSIGELEDRRRVHLADLRDKESTCNRLFAAWAAESDPLLRAEIFHLRAERVQEYVEVAALDKRTNVEVEALRTELALSEAHFAQSQILAHIQSGRRRFTPLNLARAMAGIPLITARVSCERCKEDGINPPGGIAFDTFRTIERILKGPVNDLGRILDSCANYLLRGPESRLPHSEELRKNWYFLAKAIRFAASEPRAPHGSLAFRVFAEYTKTTTAHSLVEAAKAEAKRL